MFNYDIRQLKGQGGTGAGSQTNDVLQESNI